MFKAFYQNIIISVFILLMLTVSVFGQNPVKWKLDSEAKGKQLKKGEQIKAKLSAEIEDKWYIYAIDQPAGGPIATKIELANGHLFRFNERIVPSASQKKFDPNFQIDTIYHQEKAEFELPVKVLEDVDSKEFEVKVRYQVCNDTVCLPPKTVLVNFEGEKKNVGFGQGDGEGKLTNQNLPTNNEQRTTNNQPTKTDLWSFIWLAITFGLISLLTPCVFPMIPITVSYFMKHSDGDHRKTIKLATVYSVGIIATFSLLGMLLAVFLGASGITIFAANPWVNILIAAIFIFFAFNLFGFYEISIPSSVLSKLDKIARTEEGKGSAYIGALLMGLTFTLTSFTCTSPFIGTILVSTSQGDWKMPLLGMFIFATVFALPFFILAIVPRLLHSLPRSGGWLNSVKVVMGFLEIAAAMKFISNVDLVWGSSIENGYLNYGLIFSREIVLAIWVVIGLGICAYILGFFKFKHDSPVKKLSPLRIIFALMFFALSVYLTLGVFGKKLGELESFLPPKNSESRLNILGDKENELRFIVNDLPKAIEQAKAENKKIFIDFTGYTCTNCRWMEANMFPRPAVKQELEKFVLVSLYTDGNGEIYEKQQQYQEQTFNTVAMPFYAIIDADGNSLATFPGLTRDQNEFIEFLQTAQ